MTLKSKYLFIASMDVDPEKEAIFNEVYDTEHVPSLIKVPGLVSIARYAQRELSMSIGGEIRTIRIEGEPKYTALYEVESPEVLTSAGWAEAVEEGRWPEQVRPYTRNRRHVLWERI